jgi:hypothetical protein
MRGDFFLLLLRFSILQCVDVMCCAELYGLITELSLASESSG